MLYPYLDDVLRFSGSFEEPVEVLYHVLQALQHQLSWDQKSMTYFVKKTGM